MFNFIKFEWQRRWKFFLSGIVVFILTNIDLYSRILAKKPPNFISVLLISILFALCASLVLDQMGRVYRTLFTDEGYLELTLPLSGYKLLGAKFLAVVLECIAVVLIVGMVLYVDLLFTANTYPEIFHLPPLSWDDVLILVQIIMFILCGYFTLLLMVYLSFVLAKSIFASFKYGKLIAVLCFLLIGKILGVITDLVLINSNFSFGAPGVLVPIGDWAKIFVIIGLLFISTAYLLDRKVNL